MSLSEAEGRKQDKYDCTIHGLPSFFAIGPPRTGTSWLHAILKERAWLPNPTKETRFFDKHYHRGISWYSSHYRGADRNLRVGEVSPTYFSSPEARERIAQIIPDAKVVCSFRNPVDRVLSLYRLKRAYGLIPWNFQEALEKDTELMESSRYAFHLKAWWDTLGRSQVLATTYDDLQRDAQLYLNTLVDFVGVPRVELAPAQINRVFSSEGMTAPRSYYWTRGAALLADWMRARQLDSAVSTAKSLGLQKLFVGRGRAFKELPQSELLKLYERFRPEIEELEVLLNRDFSSWKFPSPEELSPRERDAGHSFDMDLQHDKHAAFSATGARLAPDEKSGR